ncbi:MAG: DnaA N-terminal domain-containing protein [Paracoccus sp. (in: a-proteobacteria)]|nr:DnaA N-terminal domain-containing protein [Paracoccus sp. (in: a-proteobacteria)]
MQVIRPVGRDAAAKKYDILSALMAHALAGDKHRQRLVLRFMALITTRYNWQRNELAIGQAEIARLWSVDERTVKREMARLRDLGWLELKRAGARGRVAVHGISLERVHLDTRGAWANVGPDFVERMGGQGRAEESPTVVPFRRPAVQGEGLWAVIARRLAEEDAQTYSAWFASLSEAGIEDGCLTLRAPSRFHAAYVTGHLLDRLRMAARRVDATVTGVRLVVTGG